MTSLGKGTIDGSNATITMASSSYDTASSASTVVVDSATGVFSNIADKYDIGSVIGDGYHASVHECINRATGERYAVKSIRKNDDGVKMTALHREVKLLQEVNLITSLSS